MELMNITKRFGGETVLDNICMNIGKGETVLISGVSGRGKTTLLRIMMGLEKPDQGTLRDAPVCCSAVFQEDRLFDDFTPFTSIRMTAPKQITNAEIIKHLERVGLTEHVIRPVKELSGGMKRRVCIVRAILCNFDTLFLDEAFTGLDAETKKNVVSYVKDNAKGKTIVAVSHSAEDSELLGGRMIEL